MASDRIYVVLLKFSATEIFVAQAVFRLLHMKERSWLPFQTSLKARIVHMFGGLERVVVAGSANICKQLS